MAALQHALILASKSDNYDCPAVRTKVDRGHCSRWQTDPPVLSQMVSKPAPLPWSRAMTCLRDEPLETKGVPRPNATIHLNSAGEAWPSVFISQFYTTHSCLVSLWTTRNTGHVLPVALSKQVPVRVSV